MPPWPPCQLQPYRVELIAIARASAAAISPLDADFPHWVAARAKSLGALGIALSASISFQLTLLTTG